MRDVLHIFGNTPVSTSAIASLYPAISGCNQKVASLEKALCDLIANTSGLNLRYLSEARDYLENDLRFEMDVLKDFSLDIFKQYMNCGKKPRSIETIIKLLNK